MFGQKNIKLDGETYEKAKKCAAKAGYASVEEFVKHLVELEAGKTESGDDKEALEKRLKGLGYI
ncbi:MAG: hypothetical protein ABIH66_13445 [bacterium]